MVKGQRTWKTLSLLLKPFPGGRYMFVRNNAAIPTQIKKPVLDPEKPELWIEYLTIPGWLIRDQNIPQTAKFLFSLIDFLDGPNGCYASNRILANALGVGVQHISNNIRLLLNLGLIKTNEKNNQLRVLYATPPSKEDIRQAYNKRYMQPITNVIGHIYKNSKDKVNNKLLTKRDFKKSQSKSKSESSRLPKTKIDLIDIWNKIEITPNHRAGTKLHKKVIRYTNQLLNGTFGRHNSICQDFLSINKLPTDYHHTKFTIRHLKNGLENMAKIYQKGMAPLDKSWLKGMSLDKLIYNERSHKSQLLKYLYYEADEVGDQIDYVHHKANPDWIKQIKPIVNIEKLKPNARLALHTNLNKLDHYYDWMWKFPLSEDVILKRKLPDENVFFDYYINWLNKRYKVTAYNIGPEKNDFKIFLDWLVFECLNCKTSLDDNDYEKKYKEVTHYART